MIKLSNHKKSENFFMFSPWNKKFLFPLDHINPPPRSAWNFFTHQKNLIQIHQISEYLQDEANFIWWSGARNKMLHNLTLICRPFLVFILINISVWFLFSLFPVFISIRRVFVASRDGIWCGSINTAVNESYFNATMSAVAGVGAFTDEMKRISQKYLQIPFKDLLRILWWRRKL